MAPGRTAKAKLGHTVSDTIKHNHKGKRFVAIRSVFDEPKLSTRSAECLAYPFASALTHNYFCIMGIILELWRDLVLPHESMMAAADGWARLESCSATRGNQQPLKRGNRLLMVSHQQVTAFVHAGTLYRAAKTGSPCHGCTPSAANAVADSMGGVHVLAQQPSATELLRLMMHAGITNCYQDSMPFADGLQGHTALQLEVSMEVDGEASSSQQPPVSPVPGDRVLLQVGSNPPVAASLHFSLYNETCQQQL